MEPLTPNPGTDLYPWEWLCICGHEHDDHPTYCEECAVVLCRECDCTEFRASTTPAAKSPEESWDKLIRGLIRTGAITGWSYRPIRLRAT